MHSKHEVEFPGERGAMPDTFRQRLRRRNRLVLPESSDALSLSFIALPF